MPLFSPLQSWIERKDALRGFVNIDVKQPNHEFGAFLGLDFSVPFHEAGRLEAQSLDASWAKTDLYVRRSLEIIGAQGPLWLDRKEVEMIVSTLGPPPPACYPMYIVTVGTQQDERAVYVGKTSAKVRRFQSGHQVATKLHAPKYDGLQKRIYQGCITLLSDEEDYLPLEWIHPLTSADTILRSAEAQLIYDIQPELNTHHRKTCNASVPIRLHIQNFSGTELLNDHFISP